jgi:hypothetical protein
MTTRIVFALVLLALPAAAERKKDYRDGTAIAYCTPICADGRGKPERVTREACGVETYVVSQEKVGSKWSDVDLDAALGTLSPVPSCKFPSKSEGKFAPELKKVRAAYKGVKPDAVFVVENRDYSYERNVQGAIIGRRFSVKIYGKNYRFASLCGIADPNVKCGQPENGPFGPHQQYVVAINNALLYLEAAAAASKESKAYECEAGAWHAEREAHYAATFLPTASGWLKSGIKLKTMAQEALVEKPDQLAGIVEKLRSTATELYKKCGGSGPFHATGCVYMDNGICYVASEGFHGK